MVFTCLRSPVQKSSQIANNNIVQDISATVYLNFVHERSNWANSCDWSSVLTDVIPHRSAIYISFRSHGLYNALFSAFYSKQVSIMIYFYLNFFRSMERNLSFHEKQIPIIAACSGFGWMFFMHRQAVYEWKLLSKKEKINSKKFKFIFVRALFPARLISSTFPVWSLLFSSQLIRKIELIHSPRGHYLATIPLTRSQEIGLTSEIVSGINDLPAVRRRQRARHEHYNTS